MSLHTLHATLHDRYQTSMTARTHAFAADEPVDAGGTDTAASPVELLMGSLASCTAITLRMYAQRKGWPLEGVEVDVDYSTTPAPTMVKRITMRGALDATQKARMMQIAEACPVARLLQSGVTMQSHLTE